MPEDLLIFTLYGEAAREQQETTLSPAAAGMQQGYSLHQHRGNKLDDRWSTSGYGFRAGEDPRFDPRRGMSGLVTVSVSVPMADQRRGRADGRGRASAIVSGLRSSRQRLPASDLRRSCLPTLRRWRWTLRDGGIVGRRTSLHRRPACRRTWHKLVRSFRPRALDGTGAPLRPMAAHGRSARSSPPGPHDCSCRQSRLGALACDVAALLEERDITRGGPKGGPTLSCFAMACIALRSGDERDRGFGSGSRAESRRLRALIQAGDPMAGRRRTGRCVLALAYPERVARRRAEARQDGIRMVGGTGAILPGVEPSFRNEYLALADVDGVGDEVRVYPGMLRLGRQEILDSFQEKITLRRGTVLEPTGRGRRRSPCAPAGISPDYGTGGRPLAGEACDRNGRGIRKWDSLHSVERGAGSRSVSAANGSGCKTSVPADWPILSDELCSGRFPSGWALFSGRISRRAQLRQLDLEQILQSRFTFQQLKALDRLAPVTIAVPTGSRIQLDYGGGQPILAVRLQEMFGQTETPKVGGGKVKVLIHLLSPAGRPLAVTQDLPSFWKNAYPDVRKEMRGRYPKHQWPEDPMAAEPTRRVKRVKREE